MEFFRKYILHIVLAIVSVFGIGALVFSTLGGGIFSAYATSTPSGVCLLRGNASVPVFSAPDVGVGYAKATRSGINDIAGLRSACTTADYDALLVQYCAQNTLSGSDYAQQQIATYDTSGNVMSVGCGPDGANCVQRTTCSGSGGGSDTTAPTAPLSVSVTPSVSSINLSWSAATDNIGVTEYKIFRNSTLITSATGLSYSDTGLSAGTYYSYYVKAMDAAGNESPSVYASTTTLPSVTPSSIPTAPTNLELNGTPTTSSIPIRWNDNSSNEDKWNVERKLTTDSNYSGTVLAQITTANTTTYTDTTVTSGAIYDYRVQACLSGAGCSGYVYLIGVSSATQTTSPSPSPPPASIPTAPSNLQLDGAVTASSILLRWNDNSSNEDKWNVERKLTTDSNYSGTVLAQITTANTTTYTDTTVTSGATYDYRVQACLSGAGCSTYTYLIGVSSATQTTSPSPTPNPTSTTDTTAPIISSVQSQNVMSAGAQVVWTTDDLADSRIMYGTASNLGTGYPNLATSVCNSGGNVTSHCINLPYLFPSMRYYYRVFSRNQSGLDAMSGEFSFTTLSDTTTTTAAGTSSTTTTTSSITQSQSTTTSTLVPVTLSVVRGESYCDTQNSAKTKVTLSATPSSGASFIVTMNGTTGGKVLSGTYDLPNGAYSWKGVANTGFYLANPASDSFMLSKTCATLTTTTATSPTTTSVPVSSTETKTTLTTSPVSLSHTQTTTSPSPASPESTETSPAESPSSGETAPTLVQNATTLTTTAQYASYCDDPKHRTECEMYATTKVSTAEAPTVVTSVTSGVTDEILATIRTPLPAGATNAVELNALCGQSQHAARCADFAVTAQLIDRKDADARTAALVLAHEEVAKVFTERVGARVFLDSDQDGITDYDEVNIYHTDPKKSDTNGDGTNDGDQILSGSDPLALAPSLLSATSSKGKIVSSSTPNDFSNIFLKKETKITYENPKLSGDVKPELLKVTDVKGITEIVPETGATSTKVQLSGHALPNGFVTLYIFSDPIVVTVKADESGVWTYTLNKELPDGSHQVVSAITDTGGRILAKSEALPFVKEAAAVSFGSAALLPTQAPPDFFSGMRLYVTMIMLVGGLGVALIIIGVVVRRRNKEEVAPSTTLFPPSSSS